MKARAKRGNAPSARAGGAKFRSDPGESNTRVQTPGRQQVGTTSGKPRLLRWRVDALNIAYTLQPDPQIQRELQFACDRLQQKEQAPVFHVCESPFQVSVIRRHGHIRLSNADATILLDRGDPMVLLVEVRALYLATHSLADTLETVGALATHFTSAPVLEAQIERLDLCADATDLDFYRDDLDNFVSRSQRSVQFFPEARLFSQLATRDREPNGFTFSQGNPTMVRLYNKLDELSKHPPDSEKVLTELAGLRAAGWNGTAKVWRLEVQFRSKALRSLRATDPKRLSNLLDSLWQYMFVGWDGKLAWLRLIDPASATRRERCKVDERWLVFSQVNFGTKNGEAVQRIAGRRRGLSIFELVGSVLSHLGGTGLLQQPRSGTPIEQLEQDLGAILQQAKVSLVAEDYPERRANIAARFSGLFPHTKEQDAAPAPEKFTPTPPTAEERATLNFLQWVRSRDADFFTRAPSLQPEPTLYERPQYVAAQQHYEARLLGYSQAWHATEPHKPLPSPQLSLPTQKTVHNGTQRRSA